MAEGACAAIAGRRQIELDNTANPGRDVTGVQADDSDLGDLDRLYGRVSNEHGRIDNLFANAAAAGPRGIGDYTEDSVGLHRGLRPPAARR